MSVKAWHFSHVDLDCGILDGYFGECATRELKFPDSIGAQR